MWQYKICVIYYCECDDPIIKLTLYILPEDSMALHWAETTLTTIQRKYELKYLFNADGFRLSFHCLWKKMFNFRSKKCSVA